MKWSQNQLNKHFQKLQFKKQLPHNILLTTNNIQSGLILIATLLKVAPERIKLHRRVFVIDYLQEFDDQKKSIQKLNFWANLTIAEHQSQYRFFYLPELEKYSPNFINRLLKFLEDHTENVIGVLQTHQPHLILNTLLSRLQQFILTDNATLVNSEFKVWNQQFFACYQEGFTQPQKLLAIFPQTLNNLQFWRWFYYLLAKWRAKIFADAKLIATDLEGLQSGWKLYNYFLLLQQKYNHQLDFLPVWTIFIYDLKQIYQVKPKPKISTI